MYMNKEVALKVYKDCKEQYLKDQTAENWKKFCEAKTNCMRLGVRI